MKNVTNIEYVSWDDLDLRKYYTIGPSLFLCVRAAVYPSNLIKTRLQVVYSFQVIFLLLGARQT